MVRTPAYELVHQFHISIESAAAMARSHNMVRAFAITYCLLQLSKQGFGWLYLHTEIAPPVGRTVDRDSGTFVETYDGDVEIASEVGWANTNVLPMAS